MDRAAPRLGIRSFIVMGIVLLAALWWAGGCASVNETEKTAPLPLAGESIFPHKANWGEPEQHGLFVKRALFSTAACVACHGANLEGGSGPGCRSCHDRYPHDEGWLAPEVHGAAVTADGTAACTTACHGADLNGGLSGVSCQQCHDLWPHPEPRDLWSRRGHGERARIAGTAACLGCHKIDPPGGTTGVSCTQCHPSWLPHAENDWKAGGHGRAALQDGALDLERGCPLCHGATLQGGVVPTADGLTAVLACQGCHASYPDAHGRVDWATAGGHGVAVRDAGGTVACAICHGADLAGGSGPSCRSCHPDYPHAADWATGEQHGVQVLQRDKAVCATTCHGSDLQGGVSGVGCTRCHAAYPHAAGWAEPAVHGPFGEAAQRADCTGCHGTDFAGGMSGVACGPCHQQRYPHAATWSDPAEHGAAALANDAAACRTACHGEALEGGLARVSCTACHALWPHPTGTLWQTAQHGETARTVGASACLGCHKVDPPGGNTGVTCTQCHASWPAHAQDDWAGPGHGTAAQATGAMDPTSGCPLCHGADLAGGRSFANANIVPAPGCGSCHASYPNAHGAEAWPTFAGHGQYVLDDGVATNPELARERCGVCHGADLTGGKVGVSCFTSQCHAAYPHPPQVVGNDFAPWLARHGNYVRVQEVGAATLSCATARCHGTALQGDPAEAPVAEKRVKGCSDCHLTMPHPAAGAWDHGKPVVTADGRLEVDACRQCHGAELQGHDTVPSCYSCHDTYPNRHQAADWKTHAGHGAAVAAAAVAAGGTAKASAVAACGICHGSDLQGGAAGVACDACHRSVPHAPDDVLQVATADGVAALTFTDDAWAAFAQGHGAYVAGRAQLEGRTIHQQTAVECATACHGTDLATPQGGTTCSTCHGAAQFPHRFPEWIAVVEDGGTNHGEAVIAGAAAVSQDGASFATATCASSHCHGSESGELGGGTCADCHASYPALHADPAWGVGAHASLAQSSMAECQLCHGINTVGGAGVQCTDCHDPQNVYPHADAWAQSVAQSATGGLHGEAAVAGGGAQSGGCLTACHGKHGNDGFLGATVSCTGCHARYPHFEPWELPATSGYAAHAKAVINIYDSLDRSDDSFNPTKFAECSGCHGVAVTYAASQHPLSTEQQFATLPNGAQSPRCTACHRYPHLKSAVPAGTIVPWGDEWGHALTLQKWQEQQGGAMANFVQQTCGSGGNGTNGCHTGWVKKKIGPWPAGKEALCGWCHLSVVE